MSSQEQADFLGFKSVQSLIQALHHGRYQYPRYKVGRYSLAKKSEIIEYIENNQRVRQNPLKKRTA